MQLLHFKPAKKFLVKNRRNPVLGKPVKHPAVQHNQGGKRQQEHECRTCYEQFQAIVFKAFHRKSLIEKSIG